MNQYLITAFDATAPGALEHRLAVRPSHFEMAQTLKANGNFILGGAILDDHGHMIGSSMVVQFETEAALQEWLDQEPYVVQKVWEKIEVRPFKVATV